MFLLLPAHSGILDRGPVVCVCVCVCVCACVRACVRACVHVFFFTMSSYNVKMVWKCWNIDYFMQ